MLLLAWIAAAHAQTAPDAVTLLASTERRLLLSLEAGDRSALAVVEPSGNTVYALVSELSAGVPEATCVVRAEHLASTLHFPGLVVNPAACAADRGQVWVYTAPADARRPRPKAGPLRVAIAGGRAVVTLRGIGGATETWVWAIAPGAPAEGATSADLGLPDGWTYRPIAWGAGQPLVLGSAPKPPAQ